MTDKPKLYVTSGRSEYPLPPDYPVPTKKWEFVMHGAIVTVKGRRGDLDHQAVQACLRHALRAMDRPDLFNATREETWLDKLQRFWRDWCEFWSGR